MVGVDPTHSYGENQITPFLDFIGFAMETYYKFMGLPISRNYILFSHIVLYDNSKNIRLQISFLLKISSFRIGEYSAFHVIHTLAEL